MTLAFHLAMGLCAILMILLGFALRRVSHWKCYQQDDYWNHVGRADRAEEQLDFARCEVSAHKRTIEDLERALAKVKDALRDRDDQIAKMKERVATASLGVFQYGLGPGSVASSCLSTNIMGRPCR